MRAFFEQALLSVMGAASLMEDPCAQEYLVRDTLSMT